MTIHELKTWPVYFNAVLDGSKTFEVRKADRDFKVGDTLVLQEYVPDTGQALTEPPAGYTGNFATRRVTYILREPSPFAFPGFVVMGIRA